MLLLLLIFNFVNSQTVVNPPTPTGDCPINQVAPIFRSNKAAAPAANTERWCVAQNQCNVGNFSTSYYFGVSQTSSQSILIGNSETYPAATRYQTSTLETMEGSYRKVYYSTCGDSTCAAPTGSYTGRLKCSCGLQGNVASSIAPTTNLGYVTSPSGSVSSDAFYPNEIGHWIYHVQCVGNSGTNRGKIELINLTPSPTPTIPTILRRALKDGAFQGPMSLTYGKTYNSIGTTTGVYINCGNCQLASGTDRLCSFTAYRQG